MNADDVIRIIEARRNELRDPPFTDDPQYRDGAMVQRGQYRGMFDLIYELRPRSIIEIGVRAGYYAFAMLAAAPQASYLGFDNDSDTYGGKKGYYKHAEAFLARFGFNVRIEIADSQRMESLPTASVVHVDGDHSEDGCYHDLSIAYAAAEWAVLVDDVFRIHEVAVAVDRFIQNRNIDPADVEYHKHGLRAGKVLIRC